MSGGSPRRSGSSPRCFRIRANPTTTGRTADCARGAWRRKRASIPWERHQFIGGVVGWGQLTALQAENGAGGFRGNDAPYVQAFTGYRAVLGRARLGFELTLDGFNRVDRLADFQSGILPSCASTSRCPSGRTLWLPGMALNFGVDLR